MEPEIALNLWYVVDERTGFAYCLLGRAYALTGSDAEKLEKLRVLSSSDFLLARRVRIPKNFVVTLPDGKRMEGYASPADIKLVTESIFAKLINELEAALPPKFNFNNGEIVATRQSIPTSFLFVITALIEDDVGNLKVIL